MDKKLIFYLVVLAGLIFALICSVISNPNDGEDSNLTNDQIELLLDTGHFDLSSEDHTLQALNEEEGKLTHEELGRGEEPSEELVAAYDRFLKDEDEGSPIFTFALFIITGIFAGFLIVSYLLPLLVQRASEEIFGSTEKVGGPDSLTQAQTNMAQGNWDEAITHYQQVAIESPDDRLPWIEISMIQRERLENPSLALQTLDEALERGNWRENDEAFFMFRKIEICENDLNQHDQAVALLRSIIERFPQSRHSANAMHKLRELGES